MRWRTNREGLVHDNEYLCEIDGTFYDVLMYRRLLCGYEEDYITWSSEYVYEDNQITKWCPLSEIVEYLNTLDEILSALNTGDSSDEEQHKENTAKMGNTFEQLMKLDAVHVPCEPTVDVYDPDGFLLCRTNNPIQFMRIRLGIKKLGLKGYTVKTGNGDVHEISANGKIVDYPDGELPGDIYGNILQELV